MIVENQSGDIRINLALGYAEARNGTERTLVLPGGRQVTIQVPPDAQMGQEIRLADQGNSAPDGSSGTLIITLSIAPAENFGPVPFDFPSAYDVVTTPSPVGQFAPPNGNPSSATGSTPYPPQGMPPGPIKPFVSTTPPALSPRPLPRWLLPTVITFVAVIIVSSVWTLYSFAYVPNHIASLRQATAVARNATVDAKNATQAASTAQFYATQNAQGMATVTAQANATATALSQAQDDYTQITGSQPTLTDTLQAPNVNNWETGDQCFFSNNAYHIVAHTNEAMICTATATHFNNLAYQAHFTFISNDSNSGGGLAFRADDTTSTSYCFNITSSGYYYLLYYAAPDTKPDILDWGGSGFIKTDANQDNSLTVIARSSAIQLYINGYYINSLTDTNLSAGQIGLASLGGNTGGNNTEVAFTQVQVWDLH